MALSFEERNVDVFMGRRATPGNVAPNTYQAQICQDTLNDRRIAKS